MANDIYFYQQKLVEKQKEFEIKLSEKETINKLLEEKIQEQTKTIENYKEEIKELKITMEEIKEDILNRIVDAIGIERDY